MITTKNCSKCTEAFECFVLCSATEKDSSEKESCWCEEVYIELRTLEAIKELYDNCLCPACLKEYSAVSEK